MGTFISMVVFSLLEPGKSPELAGEGEGNGTAGGEGKAAEVGKGPNAIAVCLFIGAVSAVGAAYATRRLKYVR